MSASFPDHLLRVRSFLEHMTGTDAVVITSQCSLAAYLYFKRYEPQARAPLLVLLILAPTALAYCFSFTFVGTPSAVAVVFALYYGFILLYAAVYRLSPSHPLAQYPGPYLARLSKIWLTILAASGKQHVHFRKLHERYGEVVRVGPNELSISDASVIAAVLGPGGLEKGCYWDNRPDDNSLIALRNHAEHARARKPWDRALSSKALKEYDAVIATRARQLVQHLEDMIKQQMQTSGKATRTLDMSSWLGFFATDFMGDMAFGGGFELMADRGDKQQVWKTLMQGMIVLGALAHITWILPLVNMVSPGIKLLASFGRNQVNRRLNMDASRRDLFYYLSGEDAPEDERPPPDKVAQQGVLAIIAGSDTTSTTMTALLHYLVHNPSVYEQLQNEVDAAFPSGEEPLDILKLKGLGWLNACINESLRLQPPVPSGNHRFVPPGKGLRSFGAHLIPEQTQLSIHTYSIHRDPRNFYAPDSFVPQRWFEKTDGAHNLAAFIPFSYGPFACAGKGLAMMEMRMLICWLLRRFSFSALPGFAPRAWEEGLNDRFVLARDPLMLNVSLREQINGVAG
ncbi:high nitrogen upregulated cytochrome P450 monooxygenase 2 [Gloeopeniophorella convolvens]|nr:high nitrogen upregulated cytochrome P450 monooxygenase 2 [Gloeopeniophorella convolvens]